MQYTKLGFNWLFKSCSSQQVLCSLIVNRSVLPNFAYCRPLCVIKNKDTMENDLTILLETSDMVLAEDIQALLESSQIYSVLVSDNPASSVLNVYSGFNPIESIQIKINKDHYRKAMEIVKNSAYKELLTNA